MICFTSDQHFYHENIIKSVGRPFANAEEMNRVLIRNWNERVCTEDEVYIPESEQQKMEDANFQIYLAEFLAQYPLLTTNMNANMLHRELFERCIFGAFAELRGAVGAVSGNMAHGFCF